MRQALSLAQEALELGELPIAAVVVLDDGSFLMVGEDGVFRFPEANEEKGDD